MVGEKLEKKLPKVEIGLKDFSLENHKLAFCKADPILCERCGVVAT